MRFHAIVVIMCLALGLNCLSLINAQAQNMPGLVDVQPLSPNEVDAYYSSKKLGIQDIDNDGLPDSWENEHFDSLSQGKDGDPDGDGKSNYDEMRMGTDPSVYN